MKHFALPILATLIIYSVANFDAVASTSVAGNQLPSAHTLVQSLTGPMPVDEASLAAKLSVPFHYDGPHGAHVWTADGFSTSDGYRVRSIEGRARSYSRAPYFETVIFAFDPSPCLDAASVLNVIGEHQSVTGNPLPDLLYFEHKTSWGRIDVGVYKEFPACVANLIMSSAPRP